MESGRLKTEHVKAMPMMKDVNYTVVHDPICLTAPIISLPDKTPYQRLWDRLMENGWSSRHRVEAFLSTLNIRP